MGCGGNFRGLVPLSLNLFEVTLLASPASLPHECPLDYGYWRWGATVSVGRERRDGCVACDHLTRTRPTLIKTGIPSLLSFGTELTRAP
jgi:hypothetical protein